MKMPLEMSLPVQRALRTMISGVMLAQCFTVYVYLASYIVILYPVFLEERPTLVLPWLLLAAIRNLLCELTSLALGLGTCVLLGPARPPCIRFVIIKLSTIMPAFYMWVLIFGYYHNLKMASAFKIFSAVLPAKDLDYGLELAVRRRRTKSLQDEDQLRKKLMANLYTEQVSLSEKMITPKQLSLQEFNKKPAITSNEDITTLFDSLYPMPVTSNRTTSDIGTYEDWFGSEVVVPRDTDRILEQFVLMLLRISAYLKKENIVPTTNSNSDSQTALLKHNQFVCSTISSEESETPLLIGNSKGRTQSYLREYPQIFGHKPDVLSTLNSAECQLPAIKTDCSSHSAKCTKAMSTKTISQNLNNDLTRQESRNILLSSQINMNVRHEENVDNNMENEQLPTNSKLDSAASLKSAIKKIKARVESQSSEMDKDKIKTTERILNLSKYKRKLSNTSQNKYDIKSSNSDSSQNNK